MSTLLDVYELADKNNIKVNCFDLDGLEACSLVSRKGKCRVAIDPMLLRNEADEKKKLLHEVSHCITGAFYTEHDDAIVRAKCEARAERFAFKYEVPYVKLMDAVADGFTEVWEIAEYLNAPEDSVRKAIEYYQAGNR